jgi:hypothetical protein
MSIELSLGIGITETPMDRREAAPALAPITCCSKPATRSCSKPATRCYWSDRWLMPNSPH